MKISLINGSPKNKDSASGHILESLGQRLTGGHNIVKCETDSIKADKAEELLNNLCDSEIIVISFPLYVDGIPSHLLRLLLSIESSLKGVAPGAALYVLINNGFYEARQNMTAMKMMRNFSTRAGLTWGQGLGIGGGGMVFTAPPGHGPLKDLGRALDTLACNITSVESADDIYTQPNFPRRLYILAAHMGWKQIAKKNGVSRKALYGK